MAITVGTNSYGDEAGLTAYADERGVTIAGDTAELLLKAMDWLEIQPFHSYKYTEDQALQFPRALRLYGDESGEVPDRIITAQYVAALVFDAGGDPNGAIGRAIKKVKVDIIETEFMDDADEATKYPQLDNLLREYLSSYGGAFFVTRV